jgi:hypothetical protein
VFAETFFENRFKISANTASRARWAEDGRRRSLLQVSEQRFFA